VGVKNHNTAPQERKNWSSEKSIQLRQGKKISRVTTTFTPNCSGVKQGGGAAKRDAGEIKKVVQATEQRKQTGYTGNFHLWGKLILSGKKTQGWKTSPPSKANGKSPGDTVGISLIREWRTQRTTNNGKESARIKRHIFLKKGGGGAMGEEKGRGTSSFRGASDATKKSPPQKGETKIIHP